MIMNTESGGEANPEVFIVMGSMSSWEWGEPLFYQEWIVGIFDNLIDAQKRAKELLRVTQRFYGPGSTTKWYQNVIIDFLKSTKDKELKKYLAKTVDAMELEFDNLTEAQWNQPPHQIAYRIKKGTLIFEVGLGSYPTNLYVF